METQIIRNKLGAPVSVLIDYKDWLEIEQLLTRTQSKIDGPENPLDWYTLTETTNSVLNELLAYTSRERRKELAKELPDQDRLADLQALFEEVHAINDEPDNFKSASRMTELIHLYAPKVRSMYSSL